MQKIKELKMIYIRDFMLGPEKMKTLSLQKPEVCTQKE